MLGTPAAACYPGSPLAIHAFKLEAGTTERCKAMLDEMIANLPFPAAVMGMCLRPKEPEEDLHA